MALPEAIVYLMADSGHGMKIGSTRFKDQFLEAQKRLTLAGNIVINVGRYKEKTSNPCFCAIYFLSLRNLWIVRHERI